MLDVVADYTTGAKQAIKANTENTAKSESKKAREIQIQIHIHIHIHNTYIDRIHTHMYGPRMLDDCNSRSCIHV